MTETHSRRKQYKPARIPKLMDGTVPNANIPSLTSTSVIVKASSGVDNQCADKDGGYLQAGTILGSFPAGDLNGKKDNEDVASKLRLCSLQEPHADFLRNISVTSNPLNASCEIYEAGQPSPPITSSSDCDTPTTSASATFTTVLPNAIYLPVAHHDGPSSCVQVVGYPQIVIPVAIARSNSSVSRPTLYVDPVLTQGIQMASSLQIGDEIGYVHLLTSMIPSTSNDYSNFESVPSAQKVRQERSSLKRTSQASNDAKPLDLSLHIKEKRVADGSRDETPLKSGEPEAKRFPCECGVVFSSEVTLAGHRKYYCNNGTTHENAFREPQRRTPSRCHQCDFQPASASQLSQHMRTNHSVVQAYVCKLCGYKGYSQRGIKSHLRTHDDASSVESLMNNQVYAITAHSRPVQCSQCSKSFATRNLQRRHHCGDRPKSDLS